MSRFHRANTIGGAKHGNPYDTIPAMLLRSRSVKNASSRNESGTPPPLPPPRKPKALYFQRKASLPEMLSSVERPPKGLQKDQAHSSAQQLILVEDETQTIEDFSDLEFFPHTGPIATTLNEEIAMELPTISKHLLESAPSPSPSTTSRESPYEVIDKDIGESEYVHMGSDHSIRWSSNSSEFEGSVSSEISEKLENLTARINKLTNIVETTSKGEPTSADGEALTENLTNKEELQPCDQSLSACEHNRQLLATMDCNQIQLLLDAMNLSQYKEAFLQEQVSGEILLECDEDILEKELHVSSRIHRIRLMKLINGKTLAQNILNKSPYNIVFAE